MTRRFWSWWMLCLAFVLCGPSAVAAAEDEDKENAAKVESVYPIAVFPFQERGRDVEGLGAKASDLLFVNLAANPNIYLVERADVQVLISEQELNLSGIVNQEQATQVGQLTGAKVIVAGSVLQVGDKLYIVAKIIGTESSRVLGASVKGKVDDDLDTLVASLADSIAGTVSQRADDLIPAPVQKQDRLAALKKTLKGGKRPTLFIDVTERHVGQVTLDPAAATELSLFSKELDFPVIDPEEGSKNKADVLLVGQGFTQFASRHGNLTTVKARVEIKAIDRKTGHVLAVDRQVTVGVGLAEQVAAKSALQEAAADIASRLLPKLAESKIKE